jgi:hypothetical protein
MLWRAMIALFIVVNVGGAGYAAVEREPLHAGVHVALLFLGAYIMRRRSTRASSGSSEVPAAPSQLTDHLSHLEQSIDAVAIEVERMGEAQRYMTRLFSENGLPRVPDAEPIEIKAQKTPPG